jgi:hypothetical protein
MVQFQEMTRDPFSYNVKIVPGVQRDSYSMGIEGDIPGIKVAGREAGHSFPAYHEAKTACTFTATPLYVFKSWRLTERRINFIFPSLEKCAVIIL